MAETVRSFAELGLPEPLLHALSSVGYETPTPIQARTLPPLLAGRDVLGHAPTGTGKTAAFALPILARLDPARKGVQALVLTPTRELAIQVAEAFARYASAERRFSVLPVYGGQDYAVQLRALARGVQVVVGTPGRVTDHVRRGTLKLDALATLVLDEADEMLRMGFVDDVEWLLEQTPSGRQTALFSATMPPAIRRIAKRHLTEPEEIGIEGRRAAATTIRQRVWMVGGGMDKLEALTRILEVEPFEAMLVFVRTKSATVELAEKLEARGFAASAMNGDMPQKERERQVEKLRSGRLDLLVATDVVARGLDVERISHVLNFDIPYDTEAYVHRIGRTGRAGRSGEAILFVAPRERRLLGAIEHATRQKIEPLELPSVARVNERRVEAFEAGIDEALEAGDLGFLEQLVSRYAEHRELPMARVAAALARLAIGDRPLLLEERPSKGRSKKAREREAAAARTSAPAPATPSSPPSNPVHAPVAKPGATPAVAPAPPSAPAAASVPASVSDAAGDRHADTPSDSASNDDAPATPAGTERAHAPSRPTLVMERFRVEVGREHGVEPGDLVGAIANEADIRAEFVGKVDIHDDHSLVELPEGMPKFMLKELRRVWVRGRQLGITRLDAGGGARQPKAGAAERADKPTGSHRKGTDKGKRVRDGRKAGGGTPGKDGDAKSASTGRRSPRTDPDAHASGAGKTVKGGKAAKGTRKGKAARGEGASKGVKDGRAERRSESRNERG